MRLIGHNKDFFVYFIESEQKYIVFKGKNKLTTGFKFSDVKSYLQ